MAIQRPKFKAGAEKIFLAFEDAQRYLHFRKKGGENLRVSGQIISTQNTVNKCRCIYIDQNLQNLTPEEKNTVIAQVVYIWDECLDENGVQVELSDSYEMFLTNKDDSLTHEDGRQIYFSSVKPDSYFVTGIINLVNSKNDLGST